MFRSLVRLLNILSLGRDTYRTLSDRGFAGSTYYNPTDWEPQRYFAWTDTVWKDPPRDRVDVGELQIRKP